MTERHCKKKRRPPRADVSALYVHVPFCRAKCRYCSFYSRPARADQVDAYVHAAVAELDARKHVLTAPLSSVFIGGGTPTVLGRRALDDLLAPIAALIDGQTEFSVEANPESVSLPLVRTLAQAGVNRVTVGVQSFQKGLLELLGRPHGPDQAVRAVQIVRQGGITNIGIDLIYGIPGQSPASWAETLARALQLGVQHLSCYALSFEEGTALHAAAGRGDVSPMDEDLERALYEQAIERTRQAGLEHYEISSFARSGWSCRHNITYWRNLPYLGIGPAAASYIGGVRSTTTPDLEAYLAPPTDGLRSHETCERLTGRDEMAETVMLALRMTQGLDRKAFTTRFGCQATAAFPETISRYRRQGALLVTPTHIRLARSAYFVSDTILADIVAEA